MKRFHLHVSVPEIEAVIGFYGPLFNAQPSVIRDGYAKGSL